MTKPPAEPLDPFAFARPLEVRRLRRTCAACPSQWQGDVGESGSIYIRYRWGKLSARISPNDRDAVSGTVIYENDIGELIGDRLGGYMSTGELQEHLAGLCHFDGLCNEDDWAD